MPGLAQPGRSLDPAERLLDPLAQALAYAIARVSGCAAVDGRPVALLSNFGPEWCLLHNRMPQRN
jgi:hypothetical protein